MVKLMIEHGADINIHTPNGLNIFDLSSELDDYDIEYYLLSVLRAREAESREHRNWLISGDENSYFP